MSIIETEITKDVPFYDLDPMNIVWHGNYIKYMEDARCALLDRIKYNYFDMLNDGYIYPVAKVDMKFIKSSTLSQKLSVKAILTDYEPALKIKYVIKDANTDEILFKASTLQICVEAATQKSIYEAPAKLKEALKCLEI